MNEREMRRRVPSAWVAVAGTMALFLCEGLLVSGLPEANAETVRRYLPGLYEPFLRMTGEHPAVVPEAAAIEGGKKTRRREADKAMFGGLDADGFSGLLEGRAPEGEKGASPSGEEAGDAGATNVEASGKAEAAPEEHGPVG